MKRIASARITNARPITNKGIRHNNANTSNQTEIGIPLHDPIWTGGIKIEFPLKRLETMVQPDTSEKITPTPKINNRN